MPSHELVPDPRGPRVRREAAVRLGAALALALAFAPAAPAAAPPARPPIAEPRLVRVPLSPALPLAALLEAGLDVVEARGAREAMLLEWPGDAATLAGLGAAPELLDAAPGRTAARRARAELAAGPRPAGRRIWSAIGADGAYRAQTLPPFGSGSLGGFWTLDEVKMKLDDLVAGDAQDLVADRIDTLGYSVLGRPIWGLRICRAAPGPDPRPVAFFNALTHAREPGGMQAIFRFVDDLLAGYGTDPWKTSLLDHRVVYVVPVVNPDGYQFNVDTWNASGGTTYGYWRKNARDNDGNGSHNTLNDGVDLNRNFGFQWGIDNVGSSGSISSDIYRGPSAFSEPETRAQRDRVVLLQPGMALSFHTYSDLFIHPWGWTTTATNDSLRFYEWDDECTLGNGYLAGSAPRVLYEVNGEFSDWCYGDTLLKPRVFSFTPEIGNQDDGFWPPPSRIASLADETLRACYTLAAVAGPYVRIERSSLVEGQLPAGNLAHLAVRARNLGRGTTGAGLAATLVSLDPGLVVLAPGPLAYPPLGSFESADATGGATFLVAARDSVTPGRLARLRVEFTTAGGEYARDTVEIAVGTPSLIAAEDASGGTTQWLAGGSWGIVANDPGHASRYVTDSPAGLYPPNMDAALRFATPLDLSACLHAYATFETRWQLETDYDGTTLEGSLNGVSWTPLPGRATVAGLFPPQPAGAPVYEGSRWLWKPERVDLSALAGPGSSAVQLRFRSVSDGGVQFDGFSFDSLRVAAYDLGSQPAPVAVGPPVATSLSLSGPAPNPARETAQFDFVLPAAGRARLEVLDLAGRRVRVLADGPLPAQRQARGWDLRDGLGRAVPPGVYLARLETDTRRIVRRFVVLR
jgi:hypothetical protein